jgi:hypothetical protein
MRAASAWRRGTRSTCALADVELAVQGEKEKGGKGVEGVEGVELLRNRTRQYLQPGGLSSEPMSWRGCAVPYRCLNTRCRIFPVAVRGISSSWMNVTDFGRL